MSKIVQAVNSMIVNQALINPVIAGRTETFFLYRDKYLWSMRYDNDRGGYYLWHYPNTQDIKLVASRDSEESEWDDIEMVTYNSSDIGTREAKASFSELYNIVREKLYGMDEVLNDIISDGEPF